MVLTNLIPFMAGIIILMASGFMIVKSLSKIAAFLHMSEYVVGFIILAFATSLPELFVGISSALNKTPEIIIGTVIGSNIANLTIIIGIPILMAKGIAIESKKTKVDSVMMIGMAALPLLLMTLGNVISRVDGLILIAAFAAYIYKVAREGRHFKKKVENSISRQAMVASVFLFVLSLVFLYISSDFVVKYAALLAVEFALPAIFIGLFMVAIGTSLPELVSGVSAVMKGHHGMSVGNIIGSVVANSTLVVGVSAVLFPITANFLFFVISASFMVLMTIIFTAFVEEKNKISWMEGLVLVLLYVFFLMVEFYLKGTI